MMLSLYGLTRRAIRQWEPPSKFHSLRGWALWVWNEYDDWLYNGIHGFRILGFEFSTEARWLNKVCWKLLPILRFIIRRPEQIRFHRQFTPAPPISEHNQKLLDEDKF